MQNIGERGDILLWVGISIGFVVGLITGMIVLMVIRTLTTASIGDAKSVKVLSVQLLSVVSIITGATFLVSHQFSEAELKEVTQFYFYTLALIYCLLMIYPFYKLIHKLGKEFGEL